jgi:hypothetical protein
MESSMLPDKYGIRDIGRDPLIRMGEDNQTPDADGDFQNAPIFKFNDGELKFNTNFVQQQEHGQA